MKKFMLLALSFIALNVCAVKNDGRQTLSSYQKKRIKAIESHANLNYKALEIIATHKSMSEDIDTLKEARQLYRKSKKIRENVEQLSADTQTLQWLDGEISDISDKIRELKQQQR